MRILITFFYVFVTQFAGAEDSSVFYVNIVDAELNISGLSPEQEMTYKNQHEKIISYLKNKNTSEWEGEYNEGMLTGTTLLLTKNHGFSYMSWGCLGTYGIAFGDAEFLSTKASLFNKTRESVPHEVFFIKWGARHYLIPTERMIDFANAVNSGMEPCKGGGCSFWLKENDEEKMVKGMPPIPENYRGYLLDSPINTRIIEVKSSQMDYKNPEFPLRKSIVVLDVGEHQGVKVGMVFGTILASNIYETATIVEVSGSSSIGEIVEFSPSPGDERPAVGWKLSTKH